QCVGICEGAETRIDIGVVGDVVAAVVLRGGVEGREPDRVGSQVPDVLETGGDAGQIAQAVPVGIGEGAGIDLVDHGRAPPRGTGAVGECEGGVGGELRHEGPFRKASMVRAGTGWSGRGRAGAGGTRRPPPRRTAAAATWITPWRRRPSIRQRCTAAGTGRARSPAP